MLRTDQTGRAYAGSQRQIQTYVNERTHVLNSTIAQSLSQYGVEESEIYWVSPLAAEQYAEYQDSEFLESVGCGIHAPELLKFWPRGGPCWDALARIENGCILVEAKSHVAEIYGQGCGASPVSRQKIKAALNATQTWLGVALDVNWTGRLYQSANRYACLYFLREIAKVRAFLVNVYFIDDPRTPTTKNDWDTALPCVNQELGLVREVPSSSGVFLSSCESTAKSVLPRFLQPRNQ